METSGLTVSVCIPTYRRAGQLADALRALGAVEPPAGGFEVIVVDDGSPPGDGVEETLVAAEAVAPFPLRWARLTTNRGPAAARNAAWRLAEGEWIAFTDDDCRPEAGWLVALLAAGAAEGAMVVQGRTRPDPAREHLLAQPWARSMVVEAANEYFQTCNIMYRRSLLNDLGGFDEAFRAIGDDTDLGWRAVEQGAIVAFAPDALVFHDVVVRDFAADLRSRRRWVDTIRVIGKHPQARRLAWKPYVYRRSHVPLLALAAAAPLLMSGRGRRTWFGLATAMITADAARAGSPGAAIVALEQRMADGYEIALLAGESIRQRVLLL